jgi:hypothetical protein
MSSFQEELEAFKSIDNGEPEYSQNNQNNQNNNDYQSNGNQSKAGKEQRGKMREYRIYKPNKTMKGTATSWQFTPMIDKYGNETMLSFLTIAPQSGEQNGNATFDWTTQYKGGRAITVKLGPEDLADMLLVLENNKVQLGYSLSGIYHQTSRGNKIVKMSYQQDQGNFSLAVSSKSADGQTENFYQTVSLIEAKVLMVLITRALEKTFGLN